MASKFHYGDKVLIIKDPDHRGFYEGATAIVKRNDREQGRQVIIGEKIKEEYGLKLEGDDGKELLFMSEDYIQKA